MTEDRLRIYVPPVSSVNVLLALQTVLGEEQPHAVTELRRDLAEALGTIAALRAQAADISRRYDVLRLETSDILNRRNSVVRSLVSGSAHAHARSLSPAGTNLSLTLYAAATVMDAAITELRDGHGDEDAGELMDEDAGDESTSDDDDMEVLE